MNYTDSRHFPLMVVQWYIHGSINRSKLLVDWYPWMWSNSKKTNEWLGYIKYEESQCQNDKILLIAIITRVIVLLYDVYVTYVQ